MSSDDVGFQPIFQIRQLCEFRRDAHHAAELRVLAEHAVFAVDRDEELRLSQRQHHLLVLLGGVAGDVQVGVAVIDDFHFLGGRSLQWPPG